MPAPYHDVVPRFTWTETRSGRQTLIPLNNGVAHWDDPGSGIVRTYSSMTGMSHGTPYWILASNGVGVFATINNGHLGSSVPRNDTIGGVWNFPALANSPYVLSAELQWDYLAHAHPPPGSPAKVTFVLNGVPFVTLPAGFLQTDGRPTFFALPGQANGAGDVVVDFGIQGDDGDGSLAIIAYLHWFAVQSAACDPDVESHDYSLLAPGPLEVPRVWPAPRAGSDRRRLPSGIADAWMVGHDGHLRADVCWIPAVTALALPDNDGWADVPDGPDVRKGWSSFLKHCARGGSFTFYPDKDDLATSYDCVLTEIPRPTLEQDMVRSLRLSFRTTDATQIEGY